MWTDVDWMCMCMLAMEFCCDGRMFIGFLARYQRCNEVIYGETYRYDGLMYIAFPNPNLCFK
jgi:hypothetical protein